MILVIIKLIKWFFLVEELFGGFNALFKYFFGGHGSLNGKRFELLMWKKVIDNSVPYLL